MKVIILAGGFGTRLSGYTEKIPKPMINIGGRPILWHIMKSYAYFNHKDFYIALGYKGEIIKDYFLNYRSLNANFSIDLSSGNVEPHNTEYIDWRVTLVDTGLKTMTGGRIKKLKSFIGSESFLLTYGDGLANIDINKLIKFHQSHGKMITMSAVRPTPRFGDLYLDGDRVSSFQEKHQLHEGWINGGYFVMEPEIFDLIDDDTQMFEREPLEKVVGANELMAYRHQGFWHSMDTKRDHDLLESLWIQGAPWTL